MEPNVTIIWTKVSHSHGVSRDMFNHVQNRISHCNGKTRIVSNPNVFWMDMMGIQPQNPQQWKWIHYNYTCTHTHTCRTWIHFTNVRLSRKKKSWNICNLILPIWSTKTSKLSRLRQDSYTWSQTVRKRKEMSKTKCRSIGVSGHDGIQDGESRRGKRRF